jgi:transcriptional regulator with XRE-family HTH domain
MNLDTRRPNQLLRYARQEQGWSQQRLAEKIGTTEDVVSRWERGARMPSPYYREKLCLLFQKNARELGLLSASIMKEYRPPTSVVYVQGGKRSIMAYLEHFSFGKLSTTWIVMDGNGIDFYRRRNIFAHFESKSEVLPPELRARKRLVEQQQADNRVRGQAFHWNGQRYSLSRFVISRDGPVEDLVLDLWFTPSDYYTFLATNMALDDAGVRARYLGATVDWSKPVPFFSHSFGLYLTVITADNQILLTSRGSNVGSRPGDYNISVCEGLGTIDAHASPGQAPDLYACAQRGMKEELGLTEIEDFSAADIQLFSFGVDTWYAQWGLLGLVRVQKTAQDILNYRNAGVKDRLENAELHHLPFYVDEIVAFVFAHQPWAPGGLACLYHTLIHEFGRTRVAEAIARYL